MSDTFILFDASSASTGPYGLRPFAVQGQTTLVGVGLADDDVITFELMSFEGGRFPSSCECYPIPGRDPELVGVQPLMCPTCESQSPQYVRMTARNPVVILDHPVGPLIRAKYEGSGIGSSRVWGYRDPRQGAPDSIDWRATDLTPDMRGCPPVCCEDEEQTWEPTGNIMCVGEEVFQEERSNCGNLRWTLRGPVTWTPTGQERCVGHTSGEGPQQDGVVEQEERNDCGSTRWTEARPQTWTPTGQQRCGPMGQNIDGEVVFFKEFENRNDCGDTRWTGIPNSILAKPTGNVQCPLSDADSYVLSREYRDDCGNLGWFDDREPPEAVLWQDTGSTRCENHLVQRQQVNLCGRTRWVDTDEACGYKATAMLVCGGMAFGPGDERDPAATVQLMDCEGNGLGLWVYSTAAPGHTVPIGDCGGCTADGQEIEGYAVNASSEDMMLASCNTPPAATEVVISSQARTLVAFYQTSTDDVRVWSDGTVDTKRVRRYCPSYPLTGGGFAFIQGDSIDPAASVPFGDRNETVFVYPTPRSGATWPVRNSGGTVVGYAANQSECAVDLGPMQAEALVSILKTLMEKM